MPTQDGPPHDEVVEEGAPVQACVQSHHDQQTSKSLESGFRLPSQS
jgi:hypothetical protein